MSKNAPIVALVGRANVGKSSLFNAIVGKRVAIVADEPGTTRDRLTAKVETENGHFWLIDTAGLKPAEDEFELSIQDQINQALESADAIILVIEAGAQTSQQERQIAAKIHKSGKRFFLAVNKADKTPKAQVSEYLNLGVKSPFLVSATQKRGLDELVYSVATALPEAKIKADSDLEIALVGRPNVGKSSLFNTLAKKQQALVSKQAGTTRDTNRMNIGFHGKRLSIADTAGIRRSGKIAKGVEQFSVLRALAAIEQADVCVLLVDPHEAVTAIDQKIAGLVKEAGKGLIIAISKWDSIDKDEINPNQLKARVKQDFEFVPWATLVFTSSITGQNATKILELALDINTRRKQAYKTAELNAWLKRVTLKHLPAGLKNRQPKLRYMTHEAGNPVPSFKIFGSQISYLHWSYKRYLEREFRLVWPLEGTPLKFWFIDRDDRP